MDYNFGCINSIEPGDVFFDNWRQNMLDKKFAIHLRLLRNTVELCLSSPRIPGSKHDLTGKAWRPAVLDFFRIFFLTGRYAKTGHLRSLKGTRLHLEFPSFTVTTNYENLQLNVGK